MDVCCENATTPARHARSFVTDDVCVWLAGSHVTSPYTPPSRCPHSTLTLNYTQRPHLVSCLHVLYTTTGFHEFQSNLNKKIRINNAPLQHRPVSLHVRQATGKLFVSRKQLHCIQLSIKYINFRNRQDRHRLMYANVCAHTAALF